MTEHDKFKARIVQMKDGMITEEDLAVCEAIINHFSLKSEQHSPWIAENKEDPFDGEYDDPATRDKLTKAAVSDYVLANQLFLASRGDLDLIHYQQAGKERIRFLSRQLYLSNEQNKLLVSLLISLYTKQRKSITVDIPPGVDPEEYVANIRENWLKTHTPKQG